MCRLVCGYELYGDNYLYIIYSVYMWVYSCLILGSGPLRLPVRQLWRHLDLSEVATRQICWWWTDWRSLLVKGSKRLLKLTSDYCTVKKEQLKRANILLRWNNKIQRTSWFLVCKLFVYLLNSSEPKCHYGPLALNPLLDGWLEPEHSCPFRYSHLISSSSRPQQPTRLNGLSLD